MFSIIDNSPTREFTVAADLTGGAFTAVELTADGVQTAGASSVPVGILLGAAELPIDAGESISVQIEGGSLWLAGESLAAGDFLAAGAGGTAVKAASGDFIFAQALGNANPNSTAPVQIIRGGYMA